MSDDSDYEEQCYYRDIPTIADACDYLDKMKKLYTIKEMLRILENTHRISLRPLPRTGISGI